MPIIDAHQHGGVCRLTSPPASPLIPIVLLIILIIYSSNST